MSKDAPQSDKNSVLDWCKLVRATWPRVDSTNERDWMKELERRVELADPSDINQEALSGDTPLGLIALSDNLSTPMLVKVAKLLLARGANPLGGTIKPMSRALEIRPILNEPMFDALENAYHAGNPMLDKDGGSLFHLLAQSHLADLKRVKNFPNMLTTTREWLAEPRALDGLTPVHLAWSVASYGNPGQLEYYMEMLCAISHSQGVWQVDLTSKGHDGRALWETIECKTAGYGDLMDPVLLEKIASIKEQAALEKNTPRVDTAQRKNPRL